MTEETRSQWEAINNFLNPKPAEAPLPLPPAANRAVMTPAAQETAFENWITHINSRRPETWSKEEKDAVRVACNRALRTL